MIYNIIFLEDKEFATYTNLISEQEFFDILWEWTYYDDLYDFIDEDEPTLEELIEYIDNTFINENILHDYIDDTISCYVFCVNEKGIVSKYQWNQALEDYVMNKVLEYYHEVNGKFYRIDS